MPQGPRSTRPPRTALSRRTLLGATIALPSPPPTDSSDEHSDELILALCRHVGELEVSIDLNNAAWDSAVLRLSRLPAQGLVGVRAKAELLRGFLPATAGEPQPNWVSPDEQLLASLLDDLLYGAGLDGPAA